MPLPESTDEIIEIIRTDVTDALEGAFPGTFELVEELAGLLPIGQADATAVPWRWRGRHEDTFLDVRATGYPVDVTGCTILRTDERGDLVFHRLVDWQTLYRQLGLVMVCRRPRDPDIPDPDTIDLVDPP